MHCGIVDGSTKGTTTMAPISDDIIISQSIRVGVELLSICKLSTEYNEKGCLLFILLSIYKINAPENA